MTITALKPFVPSGKDFAQAKSFFTDLGFTVNWEVDGLAELVLGAAVFLLQDFHNQEMQDNFMLQVEVEDLDAWWAHLEESGVVDRYSLRTTGVKDFPWGREVHLVDPAGVCWHFREAPS